MQRRRGRPRKGGPRGINIAVYLPPELINIMDRLVEERRFSSRSELVRVALIEYLRNHNYITEEEAQKLRGEIQ